jgi:hypothetical protein
VQDKNAFAEFHRRADKVREIAEGIFDQTERSFVLKFVSDSEKLVVLKGSKHP